MGTTQPTALLTGGSGDLATVVVPMLLGRGWRVRRLDPRPPSPPLGEHIQGSILDRELLRQATDGCDAVVHIAAWHGIHEQRGLKSRDEFWDLNVTGTWNTLEACRAAQVPGMVFVSSTSVRHPRSVYGRTKLAAEQLVRWNVEHEALRAIILRPRAFIPHWNRDVYPAWIDWANWFCRGAVHVTDVARGVVLSLERLRDQAPGACPIVPLDGAYEYTRAQLAEWDKEGPGSTFASTYPQYVGLARKWGLDVCRRPTPLGGSEEATALGYSPAYSLGSLLAEGEAREESDCATGTPD